MAFNISRRQLLIGSAGAVVGTVAGSSSAAAEGRVETFGIASPGGPLDSFIRVGNRGYLVTRSSAPTLLAEFDLTTRKVIRTVVVPSGSGAWGSTYAGGFVFIGMYTNGVVHRCDPADGTISTVGRLSTSTYVWDLTTSPDGMVFVATYPDGKIWQLDPATNAVRDLGAPVQGASYARYLAATETTVVAAINTPGGHVVAIDRASGAHADITPAEPGTDNGYGPLRIGGARVYVNGGGVITDMLPDGSDMRQITVPSGTRSVDHISPHPDGTVYLSTLPSGTIYHYRTGDAGLTEVGTPMEGEGHRCLSVLDDGTVFGATSDGSVWYRDNDSVDIYELTDVGLPISAQRPQSLVYDPATSGEASTVYVGGHGGIHVHQPRQGKLRRIRVSGEPKTMIVLGGKVYAAMYPSTEIVRIDPTTDTVHSLGNIGNQQYRPSYMAYDSVTKLVVVASGPTFDLFTGALTLLDPSTGKLEVHLDVIPDQACRALTVAGGIAYVGGDIRGEGGVIGPATSASLTAYDIAARKVLWRAIPLPDNHSTHSLTYLDGVVYGVMTRDTGAWYAFDTRTREVIQHGVLSGQGQAFTVRGNVYATAYGNGKIYRIGPDLAEPSLLVDGLGDLWYNGPRFAPEGRGSWYGWGNSNADLARINVAP